MYKSNLLKQYNQCDQGNQAVDCYPDDFSTCEFIRDVYLTAELNGEPVNERHLASIRRNRGSFDPPPDEEINAEPASIAA